VKPRRRQAFDLGRADGLCGDLMLRPGALCPYPVWRVCLRAAWMAGYEQGVWLRLYAMICSLRDQARRDVSNDNGENGRRTIN
jgi:hypothetical protein